MLHENEYEEKKDMETEWDSLFRDSRYERMAEAMKLFIKCCDILKRRYLEAGNENSFDGHVERIDQITADISGMWNDIIGPLKEMKAYLERRADTPDAAILELKLCVDNIVAMEADTTKLTKDFLKVYSDCMADHSENNTSELLNNSQWKENAFYQLERLQAALWRFCDVWDREYDKDMWVETGEVYASPRPDVTMDKVYASPEPEMRCVYASPERMEGKGKIGRLLGRYPEMHARKKDSLLQRIRNRLK